MFEEEAKELVSMFGVDNPENTMGYILVLSALEQAYKKGEAAQQSVQSDGALCEDCGKNPVLEGCSVCAECGL